MLPRRPGYISVVEDRRETTHALGCDMICESGKDLGMLSVGETAPPRSTSGLFSTAVEPENGLAFDSILQILFLDCDVL